MDTFSRLEELLSTQDSRFPSASSYLAHLGAPSTSFAILDNGKITSHMITSLHDNTHTRFQACSISKPVGTAMSVFRLVETGKLELDVLISTYLPAADLELISGPATRELVGTITIRQLLSHTSGLGTHGFPGYNTKISRIPTTREILAGSSPPVNTLQVELQSFPGHRFSYSGGGTTVVQLILENVIGKPFAEIVQELVLDPLGMTESTYRYPSDEEINGLLKPGATGSGNFARAYSNGRTPCDVAHHALPEAGAAGLWTTPSDLLKAIRGMQVSKAHSFRKR
jgi:CubicO group peptidase (beta-lactamase class C family)